MKAPKFPLTIKKAMAAAGYAKASPEMRLAFMIGYLCGSMTDTGVAQRGAKAHLEWAAARATEVDLLCAQFDADLLEEVALKLAALQVHKPIGNN